MKPIVISQAAFTAALTNARRDGFRPEVLLQALAAEAQLLQTTLGALPSALNKNRGDKPALHNLADDVWRQFHATEIGRMGGDITKPLFGLDLQLEVTNLTAADRRRTSSLCGIVQSLLNSFQAIHSAALRLNAAYRAHALPLFGIDCEPTEQTVEGEYCALLDGTIELALSAADRGAVSALRLLLSLRTMESDTATLASAFVVEATVE